MKEPSYDSSTTHFRVAEYLARNIGPKQKPTVSWYSPNQQQLPMPLNGPEREHCLGALGERSNTKVEYDAPNNTITGCPRQTQPSSVIDANMSPSLWVVATWDAESAGKPVELR